MRQALACLAVLILAACGSGSKSAADEIYAYDASEPLAPQDAGVVNQDYPVKIRDVTFEAGGGGVPAFLLVPPGKGPYPAVIYLHGAGGSRVELLYSATWLAGRRAVALTVESPFAPTRAISLGRGIEGLRNERDRTVQEVIELRRAVDFLQSLPQVDDDRIGFVGYSAGGRTGAILAGVERRIKAFVFMSAGETPVAAYVESLPEEQHEQVRPLLEDTDGLKYIAQASPAKLFFQIARRDKVVPQAALDRLANTASEPKLVRRYDAGHDLAIPKAQRDQLDWLVKVLEIDGPPVEGAEAGP
jgi:dienelactone hydrolase